MITEKNETGFTRHHSESGFAVLLVLLVLVGILALVGVSYYFGVNKIGTNVNILTPTSSALPTTNQIPTGDMANWKTYVDANKKYTFKYPTEYTLSEGGSEGGGTSFSNGSTSFGIGKLGIPNKNELLMDFVKRVGVYDALTEKIEEKVFKFNDLNGVMFVSRLGKDRYSIEYIFSDDSLVYSVSFSTYDYKKTILTSDQILSTFKFTNSLSVPPKPISDIFSAINTKFKINLVPVEENEFYSLTGMVTKKSWKIDLVDANLGKGITTFLNTNLTPTESADGGGGGISGYENSQVKCYHSYGYRSGDPTNWKDPFNYLSCAEK